MAISEFKYTLPGFMIKANFYISEDPIKKLWEQILIFSSPFFIKKYWDNSDKDSLETLELINFISTSIKQAYEYYLSSLNADIHIKPLLLYYSVHNLTKAVLAAKNGDKSGLSHHGLTLPSPIEGNKGLFDIQIKKKSSGIFSSLAEKLSAPWAKKDNKTFKSETFFSGIIELNNDMTNLFESKTCIVPAEIERKSNGKISWHLAINNEKIRTEFEKKICRDEETMSEFQKKDNSFTNESCKSKEEALDKGADLLKKIFLFSVIPSNDRIAHIDTSPKRERIPQECCYFAISFLLGMLVRYHPDVLHDLLYGHELKYRLFLEKTCSHIARIYPNYMLNLLSGKFMKFVTSI